MKKLFTFLLFITVCASYAQIYKWTDGNGVVHFSDTPHSGAEIVTIPDAQALTPQANKTPNIESELEKQPAATAEGEHHYSEIEIVDPANEATIRNNQGTVDIHIAVKPKLFTGDNLQLLLDGTAVGAPQNNLSFQLSGIDRGTHAIGVQVIDAEGNVLITSDKVTIYMHRARVGMVRRSS